MKKMKIPKLGFLELNHDLKNHTHPPNNFNIKYELIKNIFVSVDLNDKKLYVDMSEEGRNNYIPHILFYKKIKYM